MICAAVERCAGIDVEKKWRSICIRIGPLDGRRSWDCTRTVRRPHIGHGSTQSRFWTVTRRLRDYSASSPPPAPASRLDRLPPTPRRAARQLEL
jgi:hypothetical protein